MPPRRVQLKSSLATVIAKAKKNFDVQKQCFQQEARDLVEKWHQNSLSNFDALQMRISELLLNNGCNEKQDIAKESPVIKIETSMPSLEPPSEQPSVVNLIKSPEDFVEEEVPNLIENQIEKFEDPMFGFANLPIFMTPSTAPKTEPFVNATFDFPNSPVTFSEYELNDIGELSLLGADVDIRYSAEQMNPINGDSHKALEKPNHSIRVNANKRIKKINDALPPKQRKKDENAVPNAKKDLLETPKTAIKHRIIIDKETLARMREQKKKVMKQDATKCKATATEVAQSLFY